MSDVKCLPVPDEHVDAIWPVIEPMLARAVATASGKLDTGDILEGARRGTYLLWIVVLDEKIVASLTSRVIEYPRCRSLALDWVGGTKMKQWLAPALRVMREHAARNGCTRMEGYGRDAWLRYIEPEGWSRDYTVFKMELGDGQ
jgi:hypothetical protein